MEDKNTILRKWVDALRSGKYIQTRRKLKRSAFGVDGQVHVSYCALGVLCHILVDDKNIKELKESFLMPCSGMDSFVCECVVSIPDWFVNELEIHPVDIINLNDEQGKSFNKIAEHIEALYLPQKENTEDATTAGR